MFTIDASVWVNAKLRRRTPGQADRSGAIDASSQRDLESSCRRCCRGSCGVIAEDARPILWLRQRWQRPAVALCWKFRWISLARHWPPKGGEACRQLFDFAVPMRSYAALRRFPHGLHVSPWTE